MNFKRNFLGILFFSLTALSSSPTYAQEEAFEYVDWDMNTLRFTDDRMGQELIGTVNGVTVVLTSNTLRSVLEDADDFSDPAPIFLHTSPVSPYDYNADTVDLVGFTLVGAELLSNPGVERFLTLAFSEPVNSPIIQITDADIGLLNFDTPVQLMNNDGFLTQNDSLQIEALQNGARGECCGGGTLRVLDTVTDVRVVYEGGFGSNVTGIAVALEENNNQAPICTAVVPSVDLIWPVNRNEFQDITLSGAIDPDGDSLTYEVTAITQDEDAGPAGRFSPDAIVNVDGSFQLRRERNGRGTGGNGRVYRVSYSVSDGNGGSCSGAVEVDVPRNASRTAVDSGQNFISTAE